MSPEEYINILVGEGMPVNDAKTVVDCFFTADEYGVASHGISMFENHLERIRRGGYNLNPNFKIIRETSAFAVIDGDNAIGPVAASYCMDYAVKNSHKSGIFTVLSNNNNTFGPAFYYPIKAAENGVIAFICSNSPAQMAPVNGIEKMLGTNPFSVVFPVPGHDPIIIDMATSVVAKSRFKKYKENGKQLPIGWALDKNGNPTVDPDEAIQGLVLPMAGFKGYAISMIIDILAGALSGGGFLNHVGHFYDADNKSMNVGFYLVAIDPQVVFGKDYGKLITQYVEELRNSKPIMGMKIALPGDDRLNHKKRAD